MKRTGLLHLYYGDGKGKTTAAMGLALRAMGSGKRVVILQFLKGGKSGEVPLLEQLGAKVYRGKAGQKFVFQMNEAEKEATRQLQNANLTAAMADPADLLIWTKQAAHGNWIWWIKPCCKRLCWNARQSRNACLLPMLRRSGCWMPPTMPPR